MTQDRELQRVISVMITAGFQVSERFSMRPRSFDLIASKGRILVIIKVVSHIDSVGEEVARDLALIAKYLGAVPLIVGERARDSELERGAAYIRYGIFAIGIATLYDFFVEGVPPLVYASPGGLYVNIDGTALRELRERRNMSLGELGQVLGVSRRTISKYESGMGTTLDIAVRIEEFFNDGVVKAIDLLERRSKHPEEPAREGEAVPISFLEQIGMELHALRRAPFQLLMTYRGEIILTAYGTAQKTVKRAPLIGNISQVTHTHAMCVLSDYDKQKKIGTTLVIGEPILHRIKHGSDLLRLVSD
jgi:putative transcriptional regulator